MMTKAKKVDLQIFKDEFEILQGAFNYAMTDEQVRIFFQVFAGWDEVEFRQSCDWVLKTSFRFPAIATLYKARVEGGFERFACAK